MRTQKRGCCQQWYRVGFICFVISTIAVIAWAGEEMEPGVSEVSVGRFGWEWPGFPEGLLDNHVTPTSICRGLDGRRWEVFFKPVEIVSGKKRIINLAYKWKFRTDPDDIGVKENWGRLEIDDSTWQELNVPGAWEKQGITQVNPKCNPQDKDPYNGYAWYRIQVEVPAEWKGQDIYLSLGNIDDFDWTYVNGRQIGGITQDLSSACTSYREYQVPQEVLRFGQKNTIAVRVYDDHGAGGIMCDPVALHVGTLPFTGNKIVDLDWVNKTWECKNADLEYRLHMTLLYPFVEITSPAARLILQQKEFPFGYMVIPTERGVLVKPLDATGYDAKRDGVVSENWMLIFGTIPGRRDVPVQLVLAHPPARITGDSKGMIQIDFAEDMGRVMLGTPFGLRTWPAEETQKWSSTIPDKVVEKARLWGRMLVCPPVHCRETFRLNEDEGDVVIRNEFTYEEGKDAWKTKPLYYAPLPPIVSYARRQAYGVNVTGEVIDMDCPTRFGPLEVKLDTQSVEYTLPLPAYEHGAFFGREDRYGWNAVVQASLWSAIFGRSSSPDLWYGPTVNAQAETMFLLDARTRASYIQRLRDTLDFVLVKPPATDRPRPITAWVNRVEPTTGHKYLYIPDFFPPAWSLNYNPENTEKTLAKRKGMCDTDAIMGQCLAKISDCVAYTAQWDLIRAHWKQIRRLYELIEVVSDWAWAGPSCTEWGGNGMHVDDCWDGYTGHGALARMAKGLGDDTTYRYARYLQAKEAIWLVSMFTFTDYLRQYYPIPPDQVVVGLGEIEPWKGVTEIWWQIQRHFSYKYRTGPESGSHEAGFGSPYGAWLTYATSFRPEGFIWPAMKDPENVKRHLDRSEEGMPDWDQVSSHAKYDYGTLFVVQPMYLRALTGTPGAEVLKHFLRLYQAPAGDYPYPIAAAANADVPFRLADWEPMQILDARYMAKEHRAIVRLNPKGVTAPVLRVYAGKEPDWIKVEGKEIPKLSVWHETKEKAGWYRDKLGYVTVRLPPSNTEVEVSLGCSWAPEPAVLPETGVNLEDIIIAQKNGTFVQGGFEGALLFAWGAGYSKVEVTQVTEPVHSGKYALRGKLLGDNKPPWIFGSQSVPLREETPYRLTAWCYVPEKTDKNLALVSYHIIWEGQGPEEGWGSLAIRAEDTPTKDWVKLTQDFPAVPKGSPRSLTIFPYCKVKGVVVYLDDISLEYLNGNK